ncbi:hypothetical protein [Nitrosomonas sp.]|uniref:hypothetical protein n=1 Tax=Nitrosomonas sp. TaxID=42353 RepID=UPI0025F6522A|nr:hypothetical protein [Nitrosomonas sp.]
MIAWTSLLLLSGGITNSWATHISQPILISPKTQYTIGESVILHGWVNYNDQATADVLLNFKVTRPDGSTLADQSYPSNSEGQFEFKFETGNETPGSYQITITSHCLEIHRYACTYKNQSLTIQLKNP